MAQITLSGFTYVAHMRLSWENLGVCNTFVTWRRNYISSASSLTPLFTCTRNQWQNMVGAGARSQGYEGVAFFFWGTEHPNCLWENCRIPTSKRASQNIEFWRRTSVNWPEAPNRFRTFSTPSLILQRCMQHGNRLQILADFTPSLIKR